MKTIGILSAALVGAGLFATSASAADFYEYRDGYRTTIHEDVEYPRPPGYGYRGVGLGDVDAAPRYRPRRVIREIYEYEDDGDLDD